MTFQEIKIIATGPFIANQLRDVNTIWRKIWHIAAYICKIYDFKIEIVPFIINFSTVLTTVVKFEVYVKKWFGRSCIMICNMIWFVAWSHATSHIDHWLKHGSLGVIKLQPRFQVCIISYLCVHPWAYRLYHHETLLYSPRWDCITLKHFCIARGEIVPPGSTYV